MSIEYVRSGTATIAFETMEGQGPPLIYLPGVISNLALMDTLPQQARFFERLNRFCTVTRFDRRGTGLSDQGAVPTMEAFVSDVEALRGAIGAERLAVLGAGQGSAVAALYAARFPDRVTHLIMVSNFVANVRDPHETMSGDNQPRLWGADTDMEQQRHDPGAWMSTFTRRMVPEADASVQAWYERYVRASITPAGAMHFLEVTRTLDVRDSLPEIRARTLVIAMVRSKDDTPLHAAYAAEHIPDARLLTVESTGFVLYVEETASQQALTEIEEFLTGRVQHTAEGRFACVLFTDIVDSTAQQQARGDRAWRDVVECHESDALRVAEQFGGRVVKFQGDGVMAVFPLASAAIRAARTLLRETQQTLGQELRAGLHAGEVFEAHGDLFGTAVNVAARIAAQAGPGEIYTSTGVTQLVEGLALEFEDRGIHELKGLGPRHLMRLRP